MEQVNDWSGNSTQQSSLPSCFSDCLKQFCSHFFLLKDNTKNHCLSKCHGLKRDATLLFIKPSETKHWEVFVFFPSSFQWYLTFVGPDNTDICTFLVIFLYIYKLNQYPFWVDGLKNEKDKRCSYPTLWPLLCISLMIYPDLRLRISVVLLMTCRVLETALFLRCFMKPQTSQISFLFWYWIWLAEAYSGNSPSMLANKEEHGPQCEGSDGGGKE